MKPSEAAVVLAFASSFDQRTLGEADARAWADALWGIDPAEARDAIVGHYRDETRRVMPADILRRVRATRRARVQGVQLPNPPAELADSARRERQWTRAVTFALSRGATEDDATAYACEQVGIRVPLALPAAQPDPVRVRELIAEATPRGVEE